MSWNILKSVCLVYFHTIRLAPSINHSYSWWYSKLFWLAIYLIMDYLLSMLTLLDPLLVQKRFSMFLSECIQFTWWYDHVCWALFKLLVNSFQINYRWPRLRDFWYSLWLNYPSLVGIFSVADIIYLESALSTSTVYLYNWRVYLSSTCKRWYLCIVMFLEMRSVVVINGLLYDIPGDTSSWSYGYEISTIWPYITPPKSICTYDVLTLIWFKNS